MVIYQSYIIENILDDIKYVFCLLQAFIWCITRPYRPIYWFYPFLGSPHFTGAGKGGQGGQKNGPPKFSCFIDPRGPPNQKLENECKNLAKKRFYKHYSVCPLLIEWHGSLYTAYHGSMGKQWGATYQSSHHFDIQFFLKQVWLSKHQMKIRISNNVKHENELNWKSSNLRIRYEIDVKSVLYYLW